MAEARGLIDEGFDGMHLNVEPVDDGNVEFLALLRALRTAVGPSDLLSVSPSARRPWGCPGRRTSPGAPTTTPGSASPWTRS